MFAIIAVFFLPQAHLAAEKQCSGSALFLPR